MENKVDAQVLKQGAACFQSARKDLIRGAMLLHKIEKEEMWRAGFSSFSEYVEQECQIGKSFASKLIKIYDSYVIQAGFPQERLEGVDSEKLYLALTLSMTPENQLLRAETWTRGEIKAELAVKNGKECDHAMTVTICAACHARV